MDIDRSLHMKEYMNIRNEYGTVKNKVAHHPLFVNLYNELIPQQRKKEVNIVVKEIEEKTINLFKKEDQPSFFTELPELTIEENEIKEFSTDNDNDNDNDFKIVQIKEEKNLQEGGVSQLKTISINPTYQVSNES